MNKQTTTVVLGLWLLVAAASAFTDKTNFYPRPLATMADCDRFAHQNTYVLVKCNAWFHEATLFIDPLYKVPLKECVMALRKMTRHTPTVFYILRGVRKITEELVDLMSALASEMDSFAKIVPQVLFFEGPGGHPRQRMNGTHRINTAVALAVAEKESLRANYNWEFFMSLMEAKKIIKTDEKFLVINAWHLVNVKEKPVIPLEFPRVFMGVVVYAEPAKAAMISKAQVMAFAGDFARPFYLDMPGSPNASTRTMLNRSVVALFVVLILVFVK